ncbi:MAG: hypothetical protein ONB44_22905 [candidate division KSB1 bacterium]|nr:hypothetical protein [candidate division KSB1 bacterium]MDZ7304989.1 hypothetical protein [candidate division KSB1 bacterium]MDZ7314032.1 hypothetical protein [candidate division KSB1 bacterium]
MSKCELSVVFDQPERMYKLGEPISGKVQVLPNTDFACRKITLVVGWRTHGRGNHASGGDDEMILAAEEKFRADEVKEFPFQFAARRGPLSYHGTYLNVEWYLRAQMDIPVAADVIKEEKFLLVPGETSEEILLGSEEQVQAEESAETTRAFRERMTMAKILAVPFVVIGIIMIYTAGTHPLALAISLAVTGFGAWQLFIMLRNKLAQQKLGKVEVEIEPKRVHAGKQVECKFLFRSQDLQRLNKITATLKGVERVASGSGDLKRTYTHTVYEATIEQTNASAVAAGNNKMLINLPLQIPSTAPTTFYAPDNALVWSIRVQIDVPDWPDWVQEFPITVIP